MESQYPIRITHGHLLLEADGRRWILDTGSPTSVGEREISLGERTFPLAGDFLGLSAERLSEYVAMPVDGLIGTDVLNAFDLIVDASAGLCRIGEDLEWNGGERLPADWILGVPVVHCCVQGRDRPLVLDTGAQLSYLALNARDREAQVVDLAEDFYPGMGRFSTPVRRFDVAIDGSTQSLRFGTLPDRLQTTLSLLGAEGILGCESLAHWQLGYFPRRGNIVLKQIRILNRK